MGVTAESLQISIDEKTKRLLEVRKEIADFKLDPDDYVSDFENMLKETYGETTSICGNEFSTPYVYKSIDDVAYNIDLDNYVSSLDLTVSETYRELVSEEEDLDYEIFCLKSDQEELIRVEENN